MSHQLPSNVNSQAIQKSFGFILLIINQTMSKPWKLWKSGFILLHCHVILTQLHKQRYFLISGTIQEILSIKCLCKLSSSYLHSSRKYHSLDALHQCLAFPSTWYSASVSCQYHYNSIDQIFFPFHLSIASPPQDLPLLLISMVSTSRTTQSVLLHGTHFLL